MEQRFEQLVSQFLQSQGAFVLSFSEGVARVPIAKVLEGYLF